LEVFKQGLRESGWVEGTTVRLELRYSEGRAARFPELAADLIRLKVDVIVTSGSQATEAAKEATATIPIVFVSVAGPVGARFGVPCGPPTPARWGEPPGLLTATAASSKIS
jgi:putative ABC transport system substrate-binding protein